MNLGHIPVKKLITWPSSKETLRVCCHEIRSAVNTTMGPPPSYIGGHEGKLLQVVFEALGLNFDIVIPNDDAWGMPDENNVWSGCPGMIQRNEADVATSAMLQNYWSFQFSDQSFSYRDEGAYFVAKTPGFVPKPFVIFQTFKVGVWISILITLFVLALAYYFIMGKKYSYGSQLYSRVAELLLQEPTVKIIPKASQEIITLFWSIAVQFLTLSYVAVILTAMMAPKTERPINNEERVLEAVRSGKYQAVTPMDMPMYLDNLLNNARPTFVKIGEIIRDNNWKYAITRKNYAKHLKDNWIIATSMFTRQLNNPLGNPIVVSEDPIYHARLCYLMRKNFPFRHKLDNIMMRILEGGIFTKLYEHDLFQRKLKDIDDFRDTHEETGSFKILSLVDLQGAFYVLIFGYSISAIALLFEIIVDKCVKKMENDDGSLEVSVNKPSPTAENNDDLILE
ncbi:glutamate receptor ionotropic, kainate glr-3-like [Parasteatoda tepidariorum]|uniref:glutamate receptor ionotropic, kainate glr-3-like n=1 Tax=Parasteatoda tepidariorum TaxID=114398 RepID=UPI00077F8A0F|nr:probable glutamate receptor [Parasteatoda tepidariorum]